MATVSEVFPSQVHIEDLRDQIDRQYEEAVETAENRRSRALRALNELEDAIGFSKSVSNSMIPKPIVERMQAQPTAPSPEEPTTKKGKVISILKERWASTNDLLEAMAKRYGVLESYKNIQTTVSQPSLRKHLRKRRNAAGYMEYTYVD